MITVRVIGPRRREDINLKNHPFPLFGRLLPSYRDGKWAYTEQLFPPGEVTEMTFPDEDYDYDAMSERSVFLGAYDGDACVGLAILQQGFFKYMYLYDLKVDPAYRGRGVGTLLIEKAKEPAVERGYRGLYTQGQDNNLAACRFYLKTGFVIGGLDTHVYQGTSQEGKKDILFYCDAAES